MATTEIIPVPNNLTWDDVRAGIAKLSEERGWHHGVPMVSIFDTSRRIVLAKGCPLSEKHGHDKPVSMDGATRVHVCTTSDLNEKQDEPYVVNIWTTKPKTIAVAKYSKGAVVEKFDGATQRLDVYMRSLLCQAGAVDSSAEFTAMLALHSRINRNQWDSYVLGGGFPETSKKSGVTYILRKGRPTLAMRMTIRPDGSEERIFLAALCTHPLAWYEGTWVGAYPPSDEVLANLLAIRADEHAFWKRANQHTIDDPLAGI